MPSGIAGAVAGGATSALLGSALSGGGPSIPNPAANLPTSITTPGFTLGPAKTAAGGKGIASIFGRLLSGGNNKALQLERTGTADELKKLGLLNEEQAKKLGGLIDRVAPGIGELTQSRLTGLENVRRRTIGDIRENLARRRVLGSSFASDAITRAEREFAQEEAEIRASSFLQELELTNKLTQQQADVLRSTVLTGLEQSNFEAQLAVNFANRTQAVMGQIGQFQAQLAAQAQSGLGAFFQPVVSGIGDAVSQGVQSLFQPTGTVFNAPNTASP